MATHLKATARKNRFGYIGAVHVFENGKFLYSYVLGPSRQDRANAVQDAINELEELKVLNCYESLTTETIPSREASK